MPGRSDNGLNLNGMIVLSIILHALVLSIFLLSPSLPTKKWTFGATYSVSLVEDVGAFSVNGTSPPKAAMSRELMIPESRPSPSIRKTDEPRAWSIIKPQSFGKDDTADNARREHLIDALRKKMDATADHTTAPRASSSAATPEQGGADAKMNAYYTRIWNRITNQWALPRGILPEHNLEAVLDIVVLRDGTIAKVSLEKGSGNPYFDESARRAVRKASPLPPLPDWINDAKLEIGLRFRSTDFR